MRDFRGLQVWERAHALTLDIYRATEGFPDEERYGLRSQIRRSAVSIGANIAEGCGHDSDREVGRFLQMAMASATELEHELLVARALALMDAKSADALIERTIEVRKMLTPMRTRLKGRPPRRANPVSRD